MIVESSANAFALKQTGQEKTPAATVARASAANMDFIVLLANWRVQGPLLRALR
jgi:hypothetical protein